MAAATELKLAFATKSYLEDAEVADHQGPSVEPATIALGQGRQGATTSAGD